jgi:hypothetical protein
LIVSAINHDPLCVSGFARRRNPLTTDNEFGAITIAQEGCEMTEAGGGKHGDPGWTTEVRGG